MSVTCPDIDSLRTWRCKVWTTSLAVNALQPKCHWTPLRRLNVHVLPSGLMCQSVANIGTKWCHGSSSTRASYTGAYWEAKTRVMRRGSFCSRSNCTATFKRSTWDGVGERIGIGVDVWADAKPRSTSSTMRLAIAYRSKSCRSMTAPPMPLEAVLCPTIRRTLPATKACAAQLWGLNTPGVHELWAFSPPAPHTQAVMCVSCRHPPTRPQAEM